MTWPFLSARESKRLLVSEMRQHLYPHLLHLGFEVFRGNDGNPKGFPTKYYRVSDNRIDAIFFQWRKWGVPKFIIDFNVIEDKEKYASFPQHGSKSWYSESRYRARRNTGFISKWFGLSLLQRALFPSAAAFNAVQSAKARINEIDLFISAGEPSPYLRDMRTLGRLRHGNWDRPSDA